MVIQSTGSNYTQFQANAKRSSAAATAPQGDIYTPSTGAGAEGAPVSYKQMLAASAGSAPNSTPAAAGGAAKSLNLDSKPNDFGVDPATGKKIEAADLPKSPVTSANGQLQNDLNYLYSTKTGKAALDKLAKDHPETKVVMGGPQGYKWAPDQGGVTIADKDGKETIYINPAYARKASPQDMAGLIAHESWHAISPNKNSLAQEKVGDDLRTSVTNELDKNYGDKWVQQRAKEQKLPNAENYTLGEKTGGADIYKQDYHEYDATPKLKPPVGDVAAEGKAAKDAGIPLDDEAVKHGNKVFQEESGGASTPAEAKPKKAA